METFKQTGLHPVWLPTSSPPSNPIEMRWEQLSDDVLRLQRDSDDWATLTIRVSTWLSACSVPNQRVLEMVGLTAQPAIRVNPA